MNKTVNINLAGIFFHIDEDAYAILQHYLDAIKRSFENTPGKDEIMADIEARIAELFSEKIKDERQVIGTKEIEEVMTIMGKPEDYLVDEEIFEDEEAVHTATKTSKQLFRDTENGYIGGVSKGLEYYMGLDAIWIRLLWILLTLGSSGAFILIYIALWIFVPEAKTTADKLAMRGEPVTISNIERKIKEGFDGVSGKMKDIDYEKYGYKARQGAGSAATAIGSAISVLLNIFVKFIGILLILIAGSTLIALFIGLFTLGTFGVIDAPWTTYFEMTTVAENSLWILSLLSFFAMGIPFFFLFILGLKILMKKVKSIGTTAKFVLLGIWIISVLGLIFFGIKQATQQAFDGHIEVTETIPIIPGDTLFLKTNSGSGFAFNNDFHIRFDENEEKMIYSSDIELRVEATKDSVAEVKIIKSAEGFSFEEAREHAKNIHYNYNFGNNILTLDEYLTTGLENKFREQEVIIILSLPEGTTLYAEDEIFSLYSYNSILKRGEEEKYLLITETGTECLDCPEEETEDSWDEEDNEAANATSEWETTKKDSISTNNTMASDSLRLNRENVQNDSLN